MSTKFRRYKIVTNVIYWNASKNIHFIIVYLNFQKYFKKLFIWLNLNLFWYRISLGFSSLFNCINWANECCSREARKKIIKYSTLKLRSEIKSNRIKTLVDQKLFFTSTILKSLFQLFVFYKYCIIKFFLNLLYLKYKLLFFKWTIFCFMLNFFSERRKYQSYFMNAGWIMLPNTKLLLFPSEFDVCNIVFLFLFIHFFSSPVTCFISFIY